jgi:hypothetical protein
MQIAPGEKVVDEVWDVKWDVEVKKLNKIFYKTIIQAL